MQRKQIAQLITALMGVASAGGAYASAFQLLEQNGQGIGNAYAGSAASAEDASTAYFNPAAMPMMKQPSQVSLGLDLVKPTAKFNDGGSTPPRFITASNVGGDGGDAGGVAPVPATHITVGLNEAMSVGLSIGAPFGLKTEYESDWMGRFHAVRSDLKSININPSFAFRINKMISVGIGASYQHFEAELTQAVNFGALGYSGVCASSGLATCNALAAAGTFNNKEGTSQVKGESDDWGWNIGIALQPTDSTRVGLSYRSAIKHRLTGDVTFTRPSIAVPGLDQAIAAQTPNGPVMVDVKLPETWILSAFQQINEQWSLQGDVSWTGWSSLKTLDICRTGNGDCKPTTDGSTPVIPGIVSSTYENWKDTWRVAFGGAYQMNNTWKFRAGLAYDQSPVEADYRTARLPDSNRTWLSLGANYRFSEAISFDVGYTHIFMSESTIDESGYHAEYNPKATAAATTGINTTNPISRGTLKGEYDGSVDILGMQMNWAF
ncbi:outer membrane protein transport protein [Niveibacterium sp. 24ML]|uniref:OmpP1/FadL family transporter n=1 Tax=Niveibacterium sp. 24ML TaxID=2985512 RepID=UPI0022702F4D|nr:outer membrane protein transport protein [Niveibacterium sp. 24ML]MCX9157756.1 outer membrane protein transport protein [Niveibacterium sp. 24ML]